MLNVRGVAGGDGEMRCTLISILLIIIFALDVCGFSYVTVQLRNTGKNIICRKSPMPADTYMLASSEILREHKPTTSNSGFDRINENIRAESVRLLAPKQGGPMGTEEMVGIFPFKEALERARMLGLDLVLVNDRSDPPVCKIADYGKLRYAALKKKKKAMKNQMSQTVKEITMSYKIDTHDLNVRVRAIQKFLEQGDKVEMVL